MCRFVPVTFVLRLGYVTSYSVVFEWKNLQDERLHTLIPVPVTCCTLTTKNGILVTCTLHYTWNNFITAGLRKSTCCL